MTVLPPVIRHSLGLRTRHRLTVGSSVGYVVFGMGILVSLWLALHPLSDGSNPGLVLLLVWVVAGITHIFIRAFWRACVISAFGSALGYIFLALSFVPNLGSNEMFGAGIIEAGLFGFLLSMLMGIPVVIHRRSRVAAAEEP